MKKLIIIMGMLALLLLCPACSGNEGAENEAATTAAAQKTEFTEGVWIKKYPDNYACFKLESPEGFQIVCDPFNINELLQPDVVTESHQHMDHSDESIINPPYERITEAGEYKIDDIVIRGYAGKHNKGDLIGSNIIFVFEMNDITIAHFASQGEVPDNEVLEQIGTVDVLLIQIFDDPDYNKLLIDDADIIIDKLGPRIIIPEHGDTDMADLLAEHLDVEEEAETSGSIIVTREMLDEMEDIRIVNLDNVQQ